MYGVTFGSITSASLNLIGAQKIIGYPAPKVSKVPVPGSDVTLDFTEAFGGVHYNNRTISLVFLSLQPWSNQMAQDSTVKNALHGKKMNIVFSDDPNYYWRGRITVGNWEYYKGAGKVIVTIDADPYKYKNAETIKTQTGDGTVTLTNEGRMPVVPYIDASAAATLEWTDHSVAISAGDDQRIPQLVLEEDVQVEIETSGTVTFHYREGSL